MNPARLAGLRPGPGRVAESIVHGQNPTDGRDFRQGLPPQREARILDLTARLPVRDRVPQLEPSPPPRRRRLRIGLVLLAGVVFGMGVGAWAGIRFKQGAAGAAALELMSDLKQPAVLTVRWPAEDNRPLRLMGLQEHRRAGDRGPMPMTPTRERQAELWLLEAANGRSDALALRALAAYHLKHSGQQHFLLLAKSELETYLAQHGPNSSVLNDLAVVLALLDRVPESLQMLEQALALDGREPVLLHNAAQVTRALGTRSLDEEKDYLLRYLAQDQGSRWRSAMEQRLRDISDFRARLVDGYSGSNASAPAEVRPGSGAR